MIFARRTIRAALAAGLFIATHLAAAPAAAAGFQWITIPDPADKPLAAAIWYPSQNPPPAEPNTPFRQALAIDAPVAGERLPLIVVSHGSGGWLGGHADAAKALADAGFVVVAITHTGNNYEDETYPTSRVMVDRPRHVSRAIDYVLGEWSGRSHVDGRRIGIFGFSFGGNTALISVGAVPNIARAIAHCASRPDEFTCRKGMLDDFGTPAVTSLFANGFQPDTRIKAAVIAAPGLGFAFDPAALAGVTAPIQLWTGENDDRVPTATNADPLAQALPTPPDYHLVKGAGHFAFMPPCNPRLKEVDPKVFAMICVDAPGFDRAAFHREFNAAVTAFFERTLPPA